MRRQPIMGMRPFLTAASMVGILAVAACEGGNLFSVPGQGGPAGADTRAPTVDISVPRGDSVSGTAIGDSVFVSVHLSDRIGVRSARFFGFSVRGDKNLGTQQIVARFAEKSVDLAAGVKDTTLSRYLLAAADSSREKAYVVVEAKDSAGNVAADTASLTVGGPLVELQGLKAGQVLSSGTRVGTRITASDPKGVSQLRLEVRGAVQSDISRAVAGDPTVVALDTSFVVADTASGFVTLTPLAKNRLGVIERGRPITVLVADRIAPLTSILQPRKDSLSAKSLGDSLLVTLRVTDSFGVRSVRLYGIARRGNVAVGTDTAVVRFSERTVTFARNVRDTTFSRYLTATADSTREAVFVVAESRDSVGNVSADTARIVVGGPRVDLTAPDAGQPVSSGGWLRYQVSASDSLGLAEVRLEVSGAVARTVTFPVAAGAKSLSRSDSLAIPDTAVGLVVLRATARNSLGARESSSSRSLTILDRKATTTQILTPTKQPLTGASLGDSVMVTTRVTDNLGVRSVRLYGIAKRGNAAVGTDTAVVRFSERTVTFTRNVRDTTFSRYLTATADSTREAVFVVAESRDSVGNVSADTARIVVGGPRVALTTRDAGQRVSAGGWVRYEVSALDSAGLAEVRLEVTGAVVRSVAFPVAAGARSLSVSDSLAIPDTAAGLAVLRATARNALGARESSSSRSLTVLDGKPPVTSILLPRGDSLSAKPLGDSVLVTARVTDNFGVRTVRMRGIAQRGSKSLGTDTVVARFVERAITLPAGVRDTTLSRYLRATKDSIKETAQIVVIAADSAGNQSSDTVDLVLGGPDVEILDIINGQSIQAGLGLTARVRAQDPLGITQVRIQIRGAFDTTIVKAITPPADSVGVDTVVAVPANVVGPIQITAIARNALDVAGQDGPLTMIVVPAGAGDTIRPVLKHGSTAPARMEMQDSVTLQITGSDQGGGVARVGYTVRAISPTRGDTLIRTDSAAFAPPRTGTVTRFFKFGTFNVDSLNLPDTLVYEISSWMRDAQGNCSASVGLDSLVALPCDTLPGGQTVAKNRTGQRVTRSVVAGKTVLLPAGGRIMDAAVDTARKKLFLSNISNNRLEVFDLQAEIFNKAIGVGSEPWGLAFTRDNDSLWVANSGGANLSVVNLDTEREVDSDRLLTPDVLLFDVELKTGEGSIQYIVTPLPQAEEPAFSDRPQFVAVDSFGNVVYSTKTSAIGNLGTARKAFFTPGWQRSEAKIFVEHGLLSPKEDFWAVAHVDSIETAVDTLSVDSAGVALIAARMALYDHVPGFPDSVITGIARSDQVGAVDLASAELVGKGSDVRVSSGYSWNIESIAFKDTTYVSASGDGGWVGIGEGGAAPVGRVLMYRASPGTVTGLSRWIQVSNLLTNPSEEVRGLGLNYDGTMAVVRGRKVAYFITPADLITQGTTGIPSAQQGSGAALHPLHANAPTLDKLGGEYRPDTHLAFVASGERTVDIIDTQRFTRVGRIYIRDIITGPLRAVLPFPADNAGYTCATLPITDRKGKNIGNAIRIYEGGDFALPIAPDGITDDRCVVMKLFAITSGGGVVVIDVRKADVLNEHPERN